MEPTGRVVVVALCVVVLAVTGSAAGLAQWDDAIGDERTAVTGATAETSLPQVDIDADRVLMAVDVRADGSAQWQVEYRLRLEDDADVQAFDELRDEIAGDEDAYLDPFVDRMERTVTTAAEATGREMSADEFSVQTARQTQPDADFGVVTFQFEWDGFAAVSGPEIHAGDALDRLFLDDETSLQIGWPADVSLVSVTPDPTVTEQQRVVWRGELAFEAGQPRVVLAREDDGTALLSPVLVLVAVGVVLLAGGVAFTLRARRRQTNGANSQASELEEPAGPPTAGESPSGAETTAASQTPPSDLLTNEERVLQLLEANGGRIKQQTVAAELDWTAAKTSQVVGDLREEGRIESFRLGRENVLTLPDVDLQGHDGS